jgi:5-methyltetrahydropteroyltriglutamate--homocysteine methyltransferase
MKKWITSNYHYLVPECDTEEPLKADFAPFLADVKRGISKLSKECATPVVVGPVTLAYLTKFSAFSIPACGGCRRVDDTKSKDWYMPKQGYVEREQRRALLHKLIPTYKQLLEDVAAMGVSEIQIHEGALSMEDADLLPLFREAYPAILPSSGTAINMVSQMEDVSASHYQWMTSVKEFSILSLDLTRGDNLKHIQEFGFPKGKALGAGIVDARSVWSIDPLVVKPILQTVLPLVGDNIRIQPSASLMFLPWDLSCEKDILVHPAGAVLSFAAQKLKEVTVVARACNDMSVLDTYDQAWNKYRDVASAPNSAVGQRIKNLTEDDFARDEPFASRRPKQLPGVPMLPTTTIGSFPQTRAIRQLRTQKKKGLLSEEEYERAIDMQIALCIGIQEGLGLVSLKNRQKQWSAFTAENSNVVCSSSSSLR